MKFRKGDVVVIRENDISVPVGKIGVVIDPKYEGRGGIYFVEVFIKGYDTGYHTKLTHLFLLKELALHKNNMLKKFYEDIASGR